MKFSQGEIDRLLTIVKFLFAPSEGTSEKQLSALENEFCNAVDHPGGAALLHYPELWGLGDSATPQEIVNEAVGWTPRVLKMTVESVNPHFRKRGVYVYGVASNGIRTQVVSRLCLTLGQTCSVAFSGAALPDGTVAKHGFVENVYTTGEIIPPDEQ